MVIVDSKNVSNPFHGASCLKLIVVINSERIVFLKYKDALGDQRRRFLGVYVANSYDHDKKAEVWKLKKQTVSINIQ